MNLGEAVSTLERLVGTFSGVAVEIPSLSSVKEALQIVLQDLLSKNAGQIEEPELKETSGALSLDKGTAEMIELLLNWHKSVSKAHKKREEFTALLHRDAKYESIRRVLKL